MLKIINNKIGKLLEFIKLHPDVSSSTLHEEYKAELSHATVKRTLQKLVTNKLISVSGKGRGTRYHISEEYELLYPVDVELYFKKEIDEREIHTGYSFSLIREKLFNVELFTIEEMEHLKRLQQLYQENISKLSSTEYKKELERLAIDLSWKSSQIEGNTYSLLETERLLKDKETAEGKTRDEATMLLNHKAALDFIIANPGYIEPLTVQRIEDIHSVLVQELNIDRNIRKRRIGISGTNYKPLDNEFQIREALEDLCLVVNHQDNIFARALLVLILVSYIQAFADGNKRTARIVSNAILMNHDFCPISFRTVNSIDYKKALLIFYEQNNISAY